MDTSHFLDYDFIVGICPACNAITDNTCTISFKPMMICNECHGIFVIDLPFRFDDNDLNRLTRIDKSEFLREYNFSDDRQYGNYTLDMLRNIEGLMVYEVGLLYVTRIVPNNLWHYTADRKLTMEEMERLANYHDDNYPYAVDSEAHRASSSDAVDAKCKYLEKCPVEGISIYDPPDESLWRWGQPVVFDYDFNNISIPCESYNIHRPKDPYPEWMIHMEFEEDDSGYIYVEYLKEDDRIGKTFYDVDDLILP